ncbi:MAG: DUF2845 domain-containing protein [Nitrospirota bacterium]|nr:DUF2845 domain-containing protein [Nitrospirota bacterium]
MKKVIVMILFIVGIASIVEAKCLRCALDAMVCEGNTKFDAIKTCGQPDYSEETSVETEGSVRRGGVRLSEQKVEKLCYNCGEKRFVKILTIKNGKIISITDGDWGSGPVKCE